MSEATAALTGTLIAQAIGALVLAFISAWVMSWRANVLRSWAIPYRSAFFVSAKAVFIALVVGVLAAHGIEFAFDKLGSAGPGLARSGGVFVGLVTWWLAHSSALMKLEIRRIVVWPKDARAITVSVFGFVAVILVASTALILATFFLISLFTTSTFGR